MRARALLSNRERCPRCHLPPRWCVCAAQSETRCPLAVDVLMHHREQFRPTSTGHLICRLLPEARLHVWRQDRAPSVGQVRRPGRELWVLHPHGSPAPGGVDPTRLQVLLLDGAWSEATLLARTVAGWGRLVSLPLSGQSRYWLRTQQGGGRFSTIEALLYLLRSLGLATAHDELRRQFELHVYASLRARGRKELAQEYLRDSPVPAAYPELLADLNARRASA